MDWSGLLSNPLESMALQSTPFHAFATAGVKSKTGTGRPAIEFRQSARLPEVITMAQCAAGGAELQPTVHTAHTVYVKTLYGIGGQDYCRHHVMRAAVAAGLIFEVKPVGGPAAALIGERPRPSTTRSDGAEPMYAITLHQPWASLIALGLKNVETRSWPAPSRLVGRRIAVHAGKRLVRRPGDAIERELRACLGVDWRVIIPTGAVVATAVLAGMAQVEYMDPVTVHAVHDDSTGVGCAMGTGRTPIDPWGDFSAGRWLWFLDDVEALPDPAPAVGRQYFRRWVGNGVVN